MKKVICAVIVVLFVFILVACTSPAPEYIEGMINLGDEFNGIVFTTIDEYDNDIVTHAYCGWEPKERVEEVIDNITYRTPYFECAASPGDPIFLGCVSLAEGYNTEDLDGDWSKQKVEFSFDGKEINLPSFGALDFISWDGKKARGWNVFIEGITPGEHTFWCRRELNDVVVETTFDITVPFGTTGALSTLSADVIPGLQTFRSENADLNYFLYIPKDYKVNSQEKWPLILSMHGLEKGAMNSMDVLENSLLKPPENLDGFPFIILSPQGTQEYAEYEIWATDETISALMLLLDEIQTKISVDPNRIYLTGDSAGGNGTWVIGVRYPDRFAALIPVMGYYGWPFAVPENICDLVDVPVWAFHGALDETVPLNAEQMLVDALKDCGGDVQFTVFPDIGHDIKHNQVYTEDLFEWLLNQTR